MTRVAERAWKTVEDKLEDGNLVQATICAGVATEKMILLMEGNPVCQVALNIQPIDIYAEWRAVTAEIAETIRQLPRSELKTIEANVVPDSKKTEQLAEIGLQAE